MPLFKLQSRAQPSHQQHFRESVAQAIRENLKKSRSNGVVPSVTVQSPPARNDAVDIPIVNNEQISPLAVVAQSTQQVSNRQQIQQQFVAQTQAEQLVTNEPSEDVTTTQHSVPSLLLTRHSAARARANTPALLTTASTTTTTSNRLNSIEENEEIDEEQAKNAHYSFGSSIQDTINDHAHTRQETR